MTALIYRFRRLEHKLLPEQETEWRFALAGAFRPVANAWWWRNRVGINRARHGGRKIRGGGPSTIGGGLVYGCRWRAQHEHSTTR